MDTESCSSGPYLRKFHPPTSHPRPHNLMTESASQDLPPDEAQPEAPVVKKAARQTKNRGAHTTAAKRAAQFEDLEVRHDGNCWCSCCNVIINVKEKSTAAKHMVSQMHKRRKLEAAKVNIKPGPSAAVEGTYTPSTIPSKAKPDMPEASLIT